MLLDELLSEARADEPLPPSARSRPPALVPLPAKPCSAGRRVWPERIAHRPRHHLREIHDHHAHAELDFARALERLLGALRRDSRRSIGAVAEGRHDPEDQQRHQHLDQREAARCRAAGRRLNAHGRCRLTGVGRPGGAGAARGRAGVQLACRSAAPRCWVASAHGRGALAARAGARVAPAARSMPAVQSTLELPGMPSEEPRNPSASAIGLLLVLASPSQTRTTTRFMLAMLVSK